MKILSYCEGRHPRHCADRHDRHAPPPLFASPFVVGDADPSVRRSRGPVEVAKEVADTAAWAAVRALTDPAAHGGEYYAPAGRLRGLPVRVEPLARTHTPSAELSESAWDQLEELAGVRLELPIRR